jgi:raffinose/stachyose/melibiose transport system permease protein
MKSRLSLLKMPLAIIVAAAWVIPFLLIVINPFKTRAEIIDNPFSPPTSFGLENFRLAWERMDFLTSLVNSLIITVLAGALLVVFPAMLAYYLARFDHRMNRFLFGFLVASMIIPFQALMIPFVSIYGSLDMLNNRWYLVLFYLGFGTALSAFLYHGFIRSIPISLEEAAVLDGASRFEVFWRVVFPMLRPVTATVLVLNALWTWNDFLLPSLVLYQSDRTLPLQTFSFYGQYTSDFGLAMAGLLLAAAPIIVFYLVMQRQIVSGVSSGAIK